MRLSLISLLLVLFMPLFSGEEPAPPELPRAVKSAQEKYDTALIKLREEYLKDVLQERNRYLQVIDREISRLRLDDEEEKVADKIVNTKDEKVKAALLTVASDKVKESLILKATREKVAAVVTTDILGNPIKVQPKEKQSPEALLIGQTYSYCRMGKALGDLTFNQDKTVTSKMQSWKWKVEKGKLFLLERPDIHYEGELTEDLSTISIFLFRGNKKMEIDFSLVKKKEE